MKCSQARKYVSRSIDNELDKHEEEKLSEHVKSCPGCSLFYEKMKSLSSSISDVFSEREMEEGFIEKLTSSLPDIDERKKIWRMVNMKKYVALAAAAAVLIVLVIPWGGTSLISMLQSGKRENTSLVSQDKAADMAAVVRLNNIDYLASNEVVTDERIIDKEIAKTKTSVTEESSNIKVEDGYATMLPAGTPIYSLKGIDPRQAVAAKFVNRWIVYRARPEKGNSNLALLYSPGYENAEKIVLTYDENGKEVKKDITDKKAIKAVAEYLKNAQSQEQMTNYYDGKYYRFYFYVNDSNGIGKLATVYNLTFADPALGGYLMYDKYYKIGPEVLKLLVPDTAGGYEEALGGSYQVYDVYASPKLLIRRYIKDENGPKPEIKIINKGEKIWRDGKLVDDDLPGNYKLMIEMKGTTIQDAAAYKLKSDYKNIPGAVSIAATRVDEDTSAIYIGFDKTPNYQFDVYGDSIMVLIQ